VLVDALQLIGARYSEELRYLESSSL